MVISNAKYGKKTGGTKNRAYLPEVDEADIKTIQTDTGMDLKDFVIPRYEEMKFLQIED